jgi:hypothetical protein
MARFAQRKMRPTPVEVTRALIARVKAADDGFRVRRIK